MKLLALAVADDGFPALDHALARHQVEEVRALAGLEQQVEEVHLAERDALAAEQLHAGRVGGLEHAVVIGGEQRDRHVVEQVLVAARGAHQVAVKRVALHRVRHDARQHAGVDAALLEIVLRAFAHGDQSLLVVVGSGENDDGREVGDRAQRAQRLQSGGVGQPEIEQHQVVLDGLQPFGGFRSRSARCHMVTSLRPASFRCRSDHACVGGVVLD